MFSLACELPWLSRLVPMWRRFLKKNSSFVTSEPFLVLKSMMCGHHHFWKHPSVGLSYDDGTSMADANCHLEVMQTNTDSWNIVRAADKLHKQQPILLRTILQSCPSNCFETKDNESLFESLFKLIQKRTLTRLVEKWGSIGGIDSISDLYFTPKDQHSANPHWILTKRPLSTMTNHHWFAFS